MFAVFFVFFGGGGGDVVCSFVCLFVGVRTCLQRRDKVV